MKKRSLVVVLSCLAGAGFLAAGLVLIFVHTSRDIPPPDVSDLAVERPVLAPEKNGCLYFFSATAALYAPPETKKQVLDYLDGKSADELFLQALIARNAETMRLVGRGVACGGCLVPKVDDYMSPLPYIVPWFNMARILAAKSRRERLAGDYAGATRSCILLLRFGDLLQRDAASLVHYFNGLAAIDLGLTQAQDLALDGRTPPDELKRLSDVLAALGPLDQGMVRAIKAEYFCAANTIDRVDQGGLSMKDLAHTLTSADSSALPQGGRPPQFAFQANKTKLLFADHCRTLIKNASLSYAEQDRHEMEAASAAWAEDAIAKSLTGTNALGQLFFHMVFPPLGDFSAKKCAVECNLGGTRLVTAFALCRKREGKYPADLQALVPAYLPAVPADPFDGKPFRYSAAKGIVYSVGKDLKDSGGSTRCASEPEAKGTSASRMQWRTAEDLVFEVAPVPPAGTP